MFITWPLWSIKRNDMRRYHFIKAVILNFGLVAGPRDSACVEVPKHVSINTLQGLRWWHEDTPPRDKTTQILLIKVLPFHLYNDV